MCNNAKKFVQRMLTFFQRMLTFFNILQEPTHSFKGSRKDRTRSVDLSGRWTYQVGGLQYQAQYCNMKYCNMKYCNIRYCNIGYCNIGYCPFFNIANIAISDIAISNIAISDIAISRYCNITPNIAI